MSHEIPRIEKTADGGHQMVVNGKPFLMLGAELQNSSMTSADYMKATWPKLKAMNINTILGCVTWEMIEPNEGNFDFAELDEVIYDARDHDLHLILLWFGSFKNGQPTSLYIYYQKKSILTLQTGKSTYVPSWVKKDARRFPRAKLRKAGGRLETTEVLSIFHSEARAADIKAFERLIQHIKDIDEKNSTVIMVQVENEVGLLGDSRDGSEVANKRFSEPVPKTFVDTINKEWDNLHPSLRSNLSTFKALSAPSDSSWSATFGDSPQTDEIFMAYNYALYLEAIAQAGKSIYSLPLYTNVWQNMPNAATTSASGGNTPGEYPSGGGVPHVIDIWQLFAPTLSFIAPDTYLNDYAQCCADYSHRKQPLMIPEQRRDAHGARRIWCALGTYQALCTAPFGIDTLEPADCAFASHYSLLKSVRAHVLKAQSSPHISKGFFFDTFDVGSPDPSPPTTVTFGEWELTISRSFVFGHPSEGYGMVIAMDDNSKFLLIGQGFQVGFRSRKPSATFSGILSFLEKEVVNEETGELRTCKMLNGDETQSGRVCIMPSDSPDYGDFPICITIPARTRIAEAVPYCLEE